MVLTQVYKLDKDDFNKTENKGKCYTFALKTKTMGQRPNETHWTTNPLKYLGVHDHSEEWGQGDGQGGAETFNNNGIETRIEYDYNGNTCFTEVPCEKPDMILKKEILQNVEKYISKLKSMVELKKRSKINSGGGRYVERNRENNIVGATKNLVDHVETFYTK